MKGEGAADVRKNDDGGGLAVTWQSHASARVRRIHPTVWSRRR